MQPYTALLPDTPPRLTDGSVSDGWRLRKLEIKNCLSSYIRQRYNAYKATGTLTRDRELLLALCKTELSQAASFESGEYARKIREVCIKLMSVLPASEPMLSGWLYKLRLILSWTNKFNQN